MKDHRQGGRRSACSPAIAALLLVGFSAHACQGVPATREQAAQHERRLLLPYLQERLVVCSELTVTISPNFHRHVSNPAVDGVRQRFERSESQARVDKTWTNLTGDRAGWFTVTIGTPPDPTDVSGKSGPRTTFKVMNEFRLVTLERGAMQLTAEASGPLVAVSEAGGQAREVGAFAVVDGVLKQ